MTAARAEAARLRESEERLAEAQGLAHVGSWTWDVDSGVVEWSEEMFRIHGYDSTEPVDFDLAVKDVVPEDRDMIRLNAMSAIEAGVGGDLPDLEYRIVRPDGEERLLAGKGSVILDGLGRRARMVGTVQDITDSRRAELNAERLKDMESRHQQALELNDEIIQGLAATKLALELHEMGKAMNLLQSTMEAARGIVSGLLRRSDIAPGDLIRTRPASPSADEPPA
jgi:PAS domain S-box-containing protein